MATLDNLKIRLGIAADDTSQDAKLNLYIADAEALFKEKTGRDDVPESAGSLIESLALLIKARQEAGYKQSETLGDYSSVHLVLNDDIPKSLRERLSRYRKAVLI